MNQDDADHLRILSIFHYVVAGVAALFACFPILHLVMGIMLLSGAFPEAKPGDEQVTRMMGAFFVALSVVGITLGLTYSILLVLSGTYLRKRIHYTFCLVMAGIACIFMPFGTVLGVFTIVVLVRPSVKGLFAATAQDAAT